MYGSVWLPVLEGVVVVVCVWVSRSLHDFEVEGLFDLAGCFMVVTQCSSEVPDASSDTSYMGQTVVHSSRSGGRSITMRVRLILGCAVFCAASLCMYVCDIWVPSTYC